MGPATGRGLTAVVSEMERLLVAVARALAAVPVRYAVGGSVASTRHGEPRMTNDLDVLLALTPGLVDAFRAAFGEAWYVPAEGVDEAVRRASSFNLIHLEWMDKVDFFVAGDGPLQQSALQRATPVRIDEVDVCFYTAEDIILQKLDGLRRSDGILDRQRVDALGVMKANRRDLDLAYLRGTAAEVGLGDLLAQCISESGLGP